MGGSASAGGSAGGGGAAGNSRVLQDVVALVMCLDPVANAKAAVTARIEGHGGRAAARLGKEVSHIVWERTRSRRPSDKAADEAQLLELFLKLEKVDYPPVVVSPLWVEDSIKAGRRLVERKYLVKKPTESLLGRTPGSNGAAAAAAKKRKRPAAAVLPKPVEAYELDDGAFSSTQQMHNNSGPAAAGPGGNRSSPAKQQRHAGAGSSKQAARGGAAGGGRGARGGAAAALPTLAEQDEEEGCEEEDDGAGQQQQKADAFGTETQAVANILTIDLPDEEHGHTPGGATGDSGQEEDELDTPLALRFARGSAERRAAWASGGSGKSSDERGHQPGGGAGGGVGAADRRSRLALASGPRVAAAEEEEDGEAGAGGGMQDAEAMEVEKAEGEEQQGQQQAQREPSRKAAAAKGVAERFSVRQLVRHPERPVVVHKGTPLPGSLPTSPAEEKPGGPIPCPLVERVTSPWALAEELPTQSQPVQPAAGIRAEPSGRPSLGQPAAKPGGRRSLLGVSNIRRASPAGGVGARAGEATPVSVVRAPPAEAGKLPSPWSTLRAWDSKAAPRQQDAAAAAAAGEAAAASGQDENKAGLPQQAEQQAEGPAAGGSGGRRQRQAQPAAAIAAPAPAAEAAPGAGPTHGCIGLTSVGDAVVDLARSATRRLRGLRLCPEGKEEGQLTHLVMGDERRTVKVMLAVANGAWLVSPQWVTASLEAGRWLPESRFPAKVRFEGAAERARSLLEDPDAAPLLGEHSIYIHLPEKARKLMGANAAALKRVALALGAKMAPPKSCTLCVVVGGGSRPSSLPTSALCVKEEWLLLAAERFEPPPLRGLTVD